MIWEGYTQPFHMGDVLISELDKGCMAAHLVLHFITSIHFTQLFWCYQILYNLKPKENNS